MKHNEIILRNQAHPRLTAETTTNAGNGTSKLFLDTGPGWFSFGPGNTSYCHMETDRNRFYFNKRVIVNEGIISSYDEDLILQRAEATSTPYIKITTSKVHNTGFTHIGNATATGYATDDGSWAARLNVSSTVHSKIEVSQQADSMRSHWYAHTGQTSIKFGTSTNHDVEFQRNGSTHLEIESGGLMTMVPIRRNSHHASGFLEGSYSNVAANGSKSNPIYTIGNGYNPNDNTLNNMYGIGYCRADQASFISIGGATNWGMYVAADGDARVWLDGGSGHVASTGEHFAGAGSATVPSFTFNNDTDTGMYRYASNQIGFATGGTYRMSIDATGLRLNTGYYIAPSTTETTDLKSATTTNFLRLRNSSNTVHGGVYGTGTEIGFLDKDSQWAIRHEADSRTYFYVNNSERVHIDNDGLDIVQGSLMMSGQHVIREKRYSGTSNIGASGAWYTLCYITENSTPAYISLKFGAHSTQTFVVTTGYQGSNVAHIQMLSSTFTQNGGYPGASAVRILKDSNNVYRFQLSLTYGSGPVGFTLDARAWGNTPINDIVSFQSSLTVDSTTGTVIDSINTGHTGSASSQAHRQSSGNSTTPGYTFHEDNNTGMYRSGSDQIGFTTNGTARAHISNTKLTLDNGVGLDLETSSGNARGMLVASETIPHLRIATSGNESIGFYDGGTSGTENIRIEGSGHLNLYTGNLKINDTSVIDSSRNLTNINAGTFGQDVSAMDTTNLDLEVVGNTSIRGSSALYFGITTNNYNSWKGKIWNNNTSTMQINAQALNFNNSGYGTSTFFLANSTGFDIRTGSLLINQTPVIDSSRNLTSIGTISSGNITASRITTSSRSVFSGGLETNNSQLRVKISVWTGATYGYGMKSGMTFGGLANNYALISQMNSSTGRGFWWGTSSHTDAQGAMALTNDGKLTVNHSMRLGYGVNDTTTPGATHALEVSGSTSLEGNLTMNSYDISGVNMLTVDDEARLPSLKIGTTTVINSSRIMTNITLGYGTGGTRFQASGWIDSDDGIDRMYFASGSTSYWKAGGSGSHIWRNGSDVSRAELDSSGNFIAEGNVTAYGAASDIRIKENIEVIPDSVEKVKSLRGVTFNYKKDGKRSTGLVAQELQKVLPEAVYETKDGAEDGEDILAIRYGNVVGLLVEAIKEQQTQLTAQQEQINQLTILVNTLMEK